MPPPRDVSRRAVIVGGVFTLGAATFAGYDKFVVGRDRAVATEIKTPQGYLQVEFPSRRIVRLRLTRKSDEGARQSYAVIGSNKNASGSNDRHGEDVLIRNGEVSVRVKPSGAVSISTTSGAVVCDNVRLDLPADPKISARWAHDLAAGETCHGLGARASGLDLRGQTYKLWNTDARSYRPGDDPLYLSVPFLLGVRDSLSYGVLWDNPARGSVDVGDKGGRAVFTAEAGALDMYVMFGANPADVLREYSTLVGRSTPPPLWALGYHQSRWGYKSSAEFELLAGEFRRRKIPCDTLHFDIDYMDRFRVFTWDPQRFPDMSGLLDSLHDKGFHSVAILDPGVAVDPAYDVFQEASQQKLLVTNHGKAVTGNVWPGECVFPDFTKQETRSWWSARVEGLADVGFDGFWNDMNEPSVFSDTLGDTLPDGSLHDGDGKPISHVAGGHNLYGMQMARATFEGLATKSPDRRPFNISRAGYAGSQRYGSTWTGDNRSTWKHLQLSIAMVINAGLSGTPFTGPDVGGFRGAPDAELYTRWMQAACLFPFFRTHSAKTAPAREPWRFGALTEQRVRLAIELRYRLLPYIYSELMQGLSSGMPLIRPLFFSDPADTGLRRVDDAFFVGNNLLAAPVTTPGSLARSVVLPQGSWFDLDGNQFSGQTTHQVSAPLDQLPLFVRAGAVLPQWPVRQHTGEPVASATLHAYLGTGQSSWYEDAGDGFDHESDGHRSTTFRLDDSDGFTIDRAIKGSYDPGYEQTTLVVHGMATAPRRIEVDDQSRRFKVLGPNSFEVIAGDFERVRVVV